MELRPEGVRVIVKPDVAERVTKGGLVIPETVHDKHQIAATRGEIVAIGPDANLKFCPDTDGVEKITAKPGDRVIFCKYGGSKLTIDREEYRVLNDVDVICLITGEEDKEDMPDTRKSMVA